MIYNKVGVKTMLNHSRYLSLPVVFGRFKKEVFSLFIDRLWKKMKRWKETFFSRTSNEVLIKEVVQAIPSYIMSYFKLPEGLYKDIETMLAKFWWGSKEDERKIQ